VRPLVFVSSLALLAATAVSAQSPTAEEIRRMQERTAAATALTEHHAALAYFLGDWDVELAVVMPGAPPQKSAARARCEWLIENRWIGEKLEGTLFGSPYQSFLLRGFDTYAKNHVAVTVQSMDTSMIVIRGVVVDPKGDVTALYGTLDEYTTGELGKPLKAVTRKLDADRFVVEVWDLGIGPAGAQVLEYRYTRRKT
jgi:hypothetical protein